MDETQATEEIGVLGSLLEVQFVDETQAMEDISVLGSLLEVQFVARRDSGDGEDKCAW